MTAYKAACREETFRSQAIVEGYPDLRRSPSEWWTADSLGKAMEAGEITPSECARLYPLATERELRMAQIEHELKLGALHALAFADSYPLPPDTPSEETGDDAELIRLGRQFEAARARETAAAEAYNEALREAQRHMPERLAALLFRASDHSLYLRKYLTHPDALEGLEVTAEDVAWMRRKPYVREVCRPVRPEDNLPADAETVVEAHPWPEAQQRADEIVTAWEAWHAEQRAILDRYVTPEINEAADAAVAVAERVAALPAHTAAGFRVKLRILSHYRPDVLDADLPDPDQLLSHSLWRDVQGDVPAATPEDTLITAILDLWPIWASGPQGDGGPPNDVAAFEDLQRRRFALIDAADALPATRQAMAPKALALAWLEYVDLWRPGLTRDDYTTDGRLALDIHAAAITPHSTSERAACSQSLDLIATSGLDLTAMPLRDLIALHSSARLLGDVAAAVSCQPKGMTNHVFNGAGLMVEWLGDALSGTIEAVERELRTRKPADRFERDQRLTALAETTINNDDPKETAAFARELLASVEK